MTQHTQDVNWQPVIDWLAGVAKAGEEFAAREAPALAEEIVRWGIVSNSITAGIALFSLLAAGILTFTIPSCIRSANASSAQNEKLRNQRDAAGDAWGLERDPIKAKEMKVAYDAASRAYTNFKCDGGEGVFVRIVIAIFLTVVSLPFFVCSGVQVLKAYTAPRLYLVEQVGKLIDQP